MSPDDDHYIGYTMTDVARLLRTVFERRVRTLGLTRAQWVTIARLHRRPGLSQSEVADVMFVFWGHDLNKTWTKVCIDIVTLVTIA